MEFEELVKPETPNLAPVNSIHQYPAKMATQLGSYFLEKYTTQYDEAKMFDPFCGSGTTLLLSRLHGFQVYGCEILELPYLISLVKNTTLTEIEQNILQKSLSHFEFDRPRELDQWENRDIWFHDEVYRDLMSIREWIGQYSNSRAYPALVVALSNVVWDVSSADPDVFVPTRSKRSQNRPHVETDQIVSQFHENIEKILDLQSIHRQNGLSTKTPEIVRGDAKRRESWPNKEFDVVLTSPPYGDGINYRRAVSLQTRFFNLSDRIFDEKITENAVGRNYYHSDESQISLGDDILSHSSLQEIRDSNPDRVSSVLTYLDDMRTVLDNLSYSLADNGIIGLVIGNPEVAGVRLPLHELLTITSETVGLRINDNPKRDKISNRFQTPIRRSSNEPIKHEYLITLKRN